MFSFRCLFIFFFCSFSVIESTGLDFDSFFNFQKGQREEVVQLSRLFRKDLSLSPKEDNRRQQNILDYLFALLSHYDASLSLEDAVLRFLADIIPVKDLGLVVINSEKTEFHGRSCDSVFFIKDSVGNLCLVLKAFKNPRKLSGKFLQEISALDAIVQLKMPNIVPIRPLAFATCSRMNEEWGLLLETAASGMRIDQFICQLSNLSPASLEREVYLSKCQKIFCKVAESLAYLHARKSSQSGPLPAYFFEAYNKKLRRILKNPFIMNEITKRIPLENFLKYIEQVRAEASRISVFYSYWHGDAHLENMFYEELANTFSFIDVARLHLAINQQGEPLLEGTMDLIRVEEHLSRIARNRLSEHERITLLHAFNGTYERSGGLKTSEALLRFHRTYLKLFRLIGYASFVMEEDPIKKAESESIFENALDYFEQQIGNDTIDF